MAPRKLSDDEKALRAEIRRCKKQGPLQKVRTLRHWKQQWDATAKFIWRKHVKWDGGYTAEPGEEVPAGLVAPVKLRRMWENGLIELAEFEEPQNVLTGGDKKRADKPETGAETKPEEPKKRKRAKGLSGPVSRRTVSKGAHRKQSLLDAERIDL